MNARNFQQREEALAASVWDDVAHTVGNLATASAQSKAPAATPSKAAPKTAPKTAPKKPVIVAQSKG